MLECPIWNQPFPINQLHPVRSIDDLRRVSANSCRSFVVHIYVLCHTMDLGVIAQFIFKDLSGDHNSLYSQLKGKFHSLDARVSKETNTETPLNDVDITYRNRLMCTAVSNVAKYFSTAIISGRSRDKVYLSFITLEAMEWTSWAPFDPLPVTKVY